LRETVLTEARRQVGSEPCGKRRYGRRQSSLLPLFPSVHSQ
jgi:hypothetical protein